MIVQKNNLKGQSQISIILSTDILAAETKLIALQTAMQLFLG